jgi:hypothetical protein
MKILYLSKADHIDYLDDCLFIGLRELFGSDVVDYNERLHCYEDFGTNIAQTMYGKGMTVTKVLPKTQVDRTDITNKIKTNFFDLIVYGSIWRCNSYITDILKYYPLNRVIAVDGEDETSIHSTYNLKIPYFKRELIYNKNRVFPISFSMPTSKINFNKELKARDIAICDPRDKTTYIYNTESDYYKGYNEARFGITMKKAGWDCMRHYEILANGCLPLFLNINECPIHTMTSFPKQLCEVVYKQIIVDKKNPSHVYDLFAEEAKTHLLMNNTTKAEALKFITTVSDLIK